MEYFFQTFDNITNRPTVFIFVSHYNRIIEIIITVYITRWRNLLVEIILLSYCFALDGFSEWYGRQQAI